MRTIFLVLFLTVLSSSVWAQKFQIGPEIGANYAVFPYFPHSVYDKPNLGYDVGIRGRWVFSERFSLTPEMNFEYQNLNTKYPELYIRTSTKRYQLNVIVPLMFSFGREKQYYFYAGGYYSYILRCLSELIDIPSEYKPNPTRSTTDITTLINRNILGYSVGAGYVLNLTNHLNLMVDASFSQSLYLFGETRFTNYSKIRAVRLMTGLLFKIK